MNIFTQRSISSKILIIVALLGLIITLFVFGFYYFDARNKIITANVEKARALCLNLENVRAEMEELWTEGTITPEMLIAYAENGEMDKVMNTVPIVSAWESAIRGSEEGGYEFRVPSFNARNPNNLPDEQEAEALRKMEGEGLDEYWFIDETT